MQRRGQDFTLIVIGNNNFDNVLLDLAPFRIEVNDLLAHEDQLANPLGNARPIQRAVNKLLGEGRRVLAWWPHVRNGDAHAGETETSMMLAIAPALVRMKRAEAGRTEPLVDLIDDLRANGVRAVSPNGVLGDPRQATINHGKALLTRMIIDLVAAVDEWRS